MGAGFEIAYCHTGTPFTFWAPVDCAAGSLDTLYVGQLIRSGGDGVLPVGTASGAADTSNKRVPLGVVIGTNNRTPVFDTTYSTQSIGSADTQALQVARDWQGNEGIWAKGDPQALVKVALIDHTSILRGRIYNAAYGTAPTVVTTTAASTDGFMTAGTTGACDFTPVADLGSIYCRKGANRGLLRITIDTSTTAPTVDTAYPQDVAIGDTFVRVPLRPIGQSYVQFDSESMYIDCSASPATNYFIIDVIALDLSVAGSEHVLFKFNGVHFDPARA